MLEPAGEDEHEMGLDLSQEICFSDDDDEDLYEWSCHYDDSPPLLFPFPVLLQRFVCSVASYEEALVVQSAADKLLMVWSLVLSSSSSSFCLSLLGCFLWAPLPPHLVISTERCLLLLLCGSNNLDKFQTFVYMGHSYYYLVPFLLCTLEHQDGGSNSFPLPHWEDYSPVLLHSNCGPSLGDGKPCKL